MTTPPPPHSPGSKTEDPQDPPWVDLALPRSLIDQFLCGSPSLSVLAELSDEISRQLQLQDRFDRTIEQVRSAYPQHVSIILEAIKTGHNEASNRPDAMTIAIRFLEGVLNHG